MPACWLSALHVARPNAWSLNATQTGGLDGCDNGTPAAPALAPRPLDQPTMTHSLAHALLPAQRVERFVQVALQGEPQPPAVEGQPGEDQQRLAQAQATAPVGQEGAWGQLPGQGALDLRGQERRGRSGLSWEAVPGCSRAVARRLATRRGAHPTSMQQQNMGPILGTRSMQHGAAATLPPRTLRRAAEGAAARRGASARRSSRAARVAASTVPQVITISSTLLPSSSEIASESGTVLRSYLSLGWMRRKAKNASPQAAMKACSARAASAAILAATRVRGRLGGL